MHTYSARWTVLIFGKLFLIKNVRLISITINIMKGKPCCCNFKEFSPLLIYQLRLFWTGSSDNSWHKKIVSQVLKVSQISRMRISALSPKVAVSKYTGLKKKVQSKRWAYFVHLLPFSRGNTFLGILSIKSRGLRMINKFVLGPSWWFDWDWFRGDGNQWIQYCSCRFFFFFFFFFFLCVSQIS